MTLRVLQGHVLEVLASLPAKHYHCVTTSPPYWMLRSYGTPPQTWPDGWVGELGQEETPERFVAHLVDCFRAVRRVLRDDGSLWVNLAGSYYSEPGGQNGGVGNTLSRQSAPVSAKVMEANRANGRREKPRHPVYKALDWVDLPGLFARAMQEDGWLWRSDVTWVKPSALPESVSGTRFERCRIRLKAAARQKEGRGGANPAHEQRPGNFRNETDATVSTMAEWAACPGCPRCAGTDGYVLRRGSGRPTKSCEQILLFVKRANYYYDVEAVREPLARLWDEHNGGSLVTGRRDEAVPGGRMRAAGGDPRASRGPVLPNPAGRNLRDAWTDIGPEPLKMQHYAAFPSALPERCLKAGTSERGCCPACGAPWARVVERRATGWHECPKDAARRGQGLQSEQSGLHAQYREVESTTLGWRPTCGCQPVGEPVPARCLDPFAGSGTTGIAANRLGRDCDLVELKAEYCSLAKRRLNRQPMSMFATYGVDASTGGEAAGG